MASPDVVLCTEDRYESPQAVDWYVANILEDDQLVARQLESHSLSSVRVSWSNPDFDWSSTRCVVLRTTWDYFDRFPEFMRWLDVVADQTLVLNPPPLVQWNVDKHYLLDLQAAGVPIVPTQIVEPRAGRSLAAELQALPFEGEAFVVKPAVSGAARHTHRLGRAPDPDLEALFSKLIATEAMIIQPFQEQVTSLGELSLIVIGGRYTHAVRKVPKSGDFRVQDDHGGSVFPHEASAEEIEIAERAVAACDPSPCYARVDVVRDNSGELAIMELELVEPELFFRYHPPSARELAAAVHSVLV